MSTLSAQIQAASDAFDAAERPMRPEVIESFRRQFAAFDVRSPEDESTIAALKLKLDAQPHK